MSKFITQLKESQNKSLFFHLCENLNVKEYNKLSPDELKYVTDCFKSFTKQGAIDLVSNYMKDTLQNSYYIDSSLDELIVIKKMCEYHKIKFSSTLTPEHQLKFTIFEHLGGWIEKYNLDVDSAHMALSQCGILFDDDFSLSKYIIDSTFNASDDELDTSIQKLISVLTANNRVPKTPYYKNIVSNLTDNDKEKLADYYVSHFDEHFSNFFELHKNDFIKDFISKPKNEIRYFCALLHNRSLESSYSLKWHQNSEDFKTKTKTVKDWVLGYAQEIHKKDKNALVSFTAIFIENSLEQAMDKNSNDSLSTYSFNLLKEFLIEIKNKDTELFDAIKNNVMTSFAKLIKKTDRYNKDKLMIIGEKLMLDIDLLDNTNSSHQEIKKKYKI